MASAIIALVTALLTLLSGGLAWAAKTKEIRDANIDQANIQRERQALAKNDSTALDAVAADQHDRVLRALGGSSERR